MKKIVENFIVSSLVKFEQQEAFEPSYPLCQRQLLYNKIHGETATLDFDKLYNRAVKKSIKNLVVDTWRKQGLLWGDFRCTSSDCSMVFRGQALQACLRCRSPLRYLSQHLTHPSGLETTVDAVVFNEELGGYLVVKLSAKNQNVLSKKQVEQPYQSELYETAVAANILAARVKIAGRLVLYMSKAKSTPFVFWVYPDLGESLFVEQIQVKREFEELVANEGFGLLKSCDTCPHPEFCQGLLR